MVCLEGRKVLSDCLFVTFLLIPSRLVFAGSRSVFMVCYCSRLVFHGSRSVFMVFHGSRLAGWFFMVPGEFSCFFMVSCCFFMVPGQF